MFPENRSLALSSRVMQGATCNSVLLNALFLLGCSVLAGVGVAVLEFKLRLPGHAILRSILPVTLGLSLVPRRMTGSLVSGGGCLMVLGLVAARMGDAGIGSMTSLLLIGPAMDAATWRTKPGWRLYLRCGLAGFGANLLAFAVRSGGKAAGWDALGMRPLAEWWSFAAISYAGCGLVAGLICAALWFRLRVPASGGADAQS